MDKNKNNQGLIIVITGDGKGKTTSAIGSIIRAISHNWKVALFQFMKGQNCAGEVLFLKKYINNKIFIQKFKTVKSRINEKNIQEDNFNQEKIITKIEEKILDNQTNLIVLDEINVVLNLNYIPYKSVESLINKKPKWKTIIFTGRNAPKQLIDKADIVSEIKNIKHSFECKIKCQKGIEY